MSNESGGNAATNARVGEAPSKTQTLGSYLCIALIEDAFAHTGSYIVRLPSGPLVPATELNQMSCLPIGPRPISSYQPKSRVLVCYMPAHDVAIILGSVTRQLSDPNLILPDSLVLRSCVGVVQDAMHYAVFDDENSFSGNHSAGRPVDVIPGDWGAVNDFGLGIWFGRMLASIRASDLAKVEAFWGDDLLRIVGYNYELFTAGSDDRRYNDEGEYNEILRLTPFPWEGMGVREPSTDATDEKGGKLKQNSEDAKFEPKEKDQLIIPRHIRLRGYLGDIEHEWVCAPPEDLETETHAAETNYHGLLEIVKHINGAYRVRSAKEIVLEKYTLIPVPKELIAPEDPLGDSKDNYEGPAQGGGYEMPEFEWGDDENPNIRSAQLADYNAYVLNKYVVGGLVAHEKDWYFPNESLVTEPVNSTVYDKDLSLKHKFMADLPTFGELTIDNRSGHTVKYYKSRSAIQMLDDGSVVIEDGYGSQLVMKGGSIFLSCVGDIFQMPGRNAVTWAPHDAIIRAGNSADISASKHDVRIKAERNLHMLGGNDTNKTGGILIESRSEGQATAADFDEIGEKVNGHGVIIKTPKSSFQVFAKDAYIGLDKDQGGTIALDAGEKGNLFCRGKTIVSKFSQLWAVLLDSGSGGSSKEMLAVNSSSTVVSTPMSVGGRMIIVPAGDAPADLIVGGNVACHGSIICDKGMATNGAYVARKGAPFVGKMDQPIDLGPGPDELAQQISDDLDAVEEIVRQEQEQITEGDDAPGNSAYQEKVGFSCRDTKEDLKLDDTFVIYEFKWQQMLRAKSSTETWDEPEVAAPSGQVTRPHPGQDGWETMEAYATVDNDKNWNENLGAAKDRDSMSEAGNEGQKKTLKTGYVINVQTE